MKRINLIRDSIKKVTNGTTSPNFRLDLRVTNTEGITNCLFVKERTLLNSGKTLDTYSAVATSSDLTNLPEFSPTSLIGFFRDNFVSIIGANPTYLDGVLTTIKTDLQTLCNSVVTVDDLVKDNTYTISSSAGVILPGDINLIEEATSEGYEFVTTVRDVDDIITSGTVIWPDGSTGVFTTTLKNTDWKTVDAYTITHATSGKTVTQSAVTRNAVGSVTVKPAMTIS